MMRGLDFMAYQSCRNGLTTSLNKQGTDISEFMGKTFQAAQLTHERFLTIDHSCNFFLVSAKLNFHQPLVCSTT